MSETPDTYLTISQNGESSFKEKGSKFISFAFAITSQEQADEIRRNFKKKYYDATHVVYAFRLGAEGNIFRAADDGEPSGSSGLPVLNAIKSAGLSDVIVLVVRYFGGTKLGIPGLIEAYGRAAREVLIVSGSKSTDIVENVTVEVDYQMFNFVMRIVKEQNLKITETVQRKNCRITMAVKKNSVKKITDILNQNGQITV